MNINIPAEAAEGMAITHSFAYEIDGVRYTLAEDANGDLFIYSPSQFGFWRPASGGVCIDL